MTDKNVTLRIRVKKVMAALMSVLLILTLVTAISFDASISVNAVGEEETAAGTPETAPAEGEAASGEAQAAPAEGTAPADGTAAPAEGTAPADGTAAPAGGTAPAEGTAPTDGTAAPAEGDPFPEVAPEGLLGGEDIEDEESSDPLDTGLKRQTGPPEVTADSFIVMSGSTSEVVLEKHSDRKLSPGNITMLMTAMVVIDNMYNDRELNNTVEITDKLTEYGSDFKLGETVKVGDLLNAMLIGGSEQAAEALARYSASKRKIFISEMNSKAMELGLMDTQFTNPSGAYDAQHYSTAHDCAIIIQGATRYQLIKNAFAKRNTTFTVLSADGDREVSYTSTNPLLVGSKPSELYSLTRGGLLGRVGDPVNKSQYAGVATSDDMQLIVVLLNAKKKKVAYEAKALFEYGDSKVTRSVIVKANKKVGKARVRYGSVAHVNAYTETKGFAYVPPEGSTDLVQTEVVMFEDLTAPIKEGTKVGEFRIYVADELKGTVDLITKRSIKRGWWPSKYYISDWVTVVIGVILFLILLLFIRILYVKKRRAQIKAARRERRLRELAMMQLEAEEDRRRRNWDNRTAPVIDDKTALRIGDLREEARKETLREEMIAEAAKTGVSAKTLMKKAAKAEKKKTAVREKSKEKSQEKPQEKTQNNTIQ